MSEVGHALTPVLSRKTELLALTLDCETVHAHDRGFRVFNPDVFPSY